MLFVQAHAAADEEPSSGELEPLIKKEEKTPDNPLGGDPPTNSTIIDVASTESGESPCVSEHQVIFWRPVHDEVRKSLGEEAFTARRNKFEDMQMTTSDRKSLEQRKNDYRKMDEKKAAARKG